MTKIEKGSGLVTFINTFTLAPENQQRLVEMLTQVTAHTVRRGEGFVSASMHKSTDGKKVVMYSQWRSMADYERMRADVTSAPILRDVMTFATFEPGSFEVVETFEP